MPLMALKPLADGQQQELTSEKYNSSSPAFSRDGQWLYFLSERFFGASPAHPWGDRNMGSIMDRRSQIFAYDLTGKGNFPFQTENELLNADVTQDDDETADDDIVNWR